MDEADRPVQQRGRLPVVTGERASFRVAGTNDPVPAVGDEWR